ncbi:MAG: hypothetical protein WCG27_04645 [Pseudomonadota bacterium]
MLITAFVILCILYAYWSDYNLATGSGNLSMFLFILAQVYIPIKRIRLAFMLKDDAFSAAILRIHCALNVGAFTAVCIHCYVTKWHNTELWISLIIMGWLTIGGMILRYKYPPTIRKGLYFLHTQDVLFIVLCFCLLKGHYVF